MNGHRKLAGVGLAVALTLTGAACGGDDEAADKLAEEIIEQSGGGDVDIDSDGGSIKYTDDEGNVTEIGGAELPDGWPADLAPPESVTLISSSTQKVDGRTSLYALGEAEGSIEDYYEGLKTQVTDAGFTIESDSSLSGSGGGYSAFSGASDTYDISVTVTDGSEDGMVNIAITLAEIAES